MRIAPGPLLAVLVLAAGCSAGPSPRPWPPREETLAGLPAPGQAVVRATILECRAAGLAAPRTRRLELSEVAALLRDPSVRCIQAPSLVTLLDQEARISVGEQGPHTENRFAGISLSVKVGSNGLTSLGLEIGEVDRRTPGVHPNASVWFEPLEESPLLAFEVPGTTQTVETHLFRPDEVRDEERVYVVLLDVERA